MRVNVNELPHRPAEHWNEYLDAENRGTRNQKLGSLDRFIGSLLDLPKETWTDWAITLCLLHETGKAPIPIRQQLFVKVLFPAMMHSWKSGTAGSLRLMAGFFDHVYRCRTCIREIPEELQSPELLLREELRLNPNDQCAGLMLVSSMAGYLAHTLHELPDGVLYGMDGASISECVELTEYIVEFQELVDRFGVRDNYRELIHDATFHFNAYCAYLQNGDYARGYRGFLKTYSTP